MDAEKNCDGEERRMSKEKMKQKMREMIPFFEVVIHIIDKDDSYFFERVQREELDKLCRYTKENLCNSCEYSVILKNYELLTKLHDSYKFFQAPTTVKKTQNPITIINLASPSKQNASLDFLENAGVHLVPELVNLEESGDDDIPNNISSRTNPNQENSLPESTNELLSISESCEPIFTEPQGQIKIQQPAVKVTRRTCSLTSKLSHDPVYSKNPKKSKKRKPRKDHSDKESELNIPDDTVTEVTKRKHVAEKNDENQSMNDSTSMKENTSKTKKPKNAVEKSKGGTEEPKSPGKLVPDNEGQPLSLEDIKTLVWGKSWKCIHCPYRGKKLVQHFVTKHPTREVIVSRLSEREAKLCIEESRKFGKLREPEKVVIEYKCRFCSFVAADGIVRLRLEKFYEHCTTHTGEYIYRCVECSFKAMKASTVKKHYYSLCKKVTNCTKPAGEVMGRIEISCGTQVYGYMCSKCNFVQLEENNLNEHVKKCRSEDLDAVVVKINMSSSDDGFGCIKSEPDSASFFYAGIVEPKFELVAMKMP